MTKTKPDGAEIEIIIPDGHRLTVDDFFYVVTMMQENIVGAERVALQITYEDGAQLTAEHDDLLRDRKI